ncbi:MAG: 1-acyl-sn-glycerol-3-phosphate acyltransferase [Bacteroidota bacterium]
MNHWFWRFVLKTMGWNTDGRVPAGIKKAVIISAPHTSYWDFVIGWMTFRVADVNIRFLIKAEAFKGFMGWFLTKLGGIPVSRGKKNNMVEQLKIMFDSSESFYVVITPEGTRKLVTQWKKGFYLIAMDAGVPVVCSFINYRDKTGGIGPVITPSGDFEKDMLVIQNFYRDKQAKYPERFNLSGT